MECVRYKLVKTQLTLVDASSSGEVARLKDAMEIVEGEITHM